MRQMVLKGNEKALEEVVGIYQDISVRLGQLDRPLGADAKKAMEQFLETFSIKVAAQKQYVDKFPAWAKALCEITSDTLGIKHCPTGWREAKNVSLRWITN